MAGESPKRMYTYLVHCAIDIQYTFTEEEVEIDGEGGDDLSPTHEALKVLESEVKDYLADRFAVSAVEINAESDDLLGKHE